MSVVSVAVAAVVAAAVSAVIAAAVSAAVVVAGAGEPPDEAHAAAEIAKSVMNALLRKLVNDFL